MQNKLRVLFLQSQAQTWSWSIANVHRMLLQHFARERVEISMACAVGVGGAKTPAYALFEDIADLHLLPTNFGPSVFHGGSKLEIAKNLLSTSFAVPGSMLGLINYVKRHHIDIIHSAEMPRDALCNVFLARMTGAKSVIQLHTKCASWMRPAALRAFRQADGIIGVSDFVAQSAIVMGCRPERVYHALNSLDASRWDYEIDGSSLRQELHIPPGALVFAIVGRVAPGKGHEALFKALAQIKDRMPDFRLLIVGEDAPLKGSGSYVAYLREKMYTLGLSQQVIFTGARADIPTVLAACDLYTMPALDEGFCLAILEAMAMKKAVIAANQGGPREIVEQGRSGLLSVPDDIEQLADNILTLVNDPVLRKRMGEYGRKRVEEYFNPQRLANEVEHIYRRVLHQPDVLDEKTGLISVKA